ncbi:MAG TPA: hypothetical protein VK614_08220 [Allosphingosinicella sp.]|nr:hypothetical protein [Allosphingosinicella sp.]
MVSVTPSLPPDRYHTVTPSLEFMLEDEVFLAGPRIYALTGENGSGKTTFVERILLPALRKNDQSAFYLGADVEIARFSMLASLAVRRTVQRREDLYDGNEPPLTGIARTARAIVLEMGNAQALVIDEYKENLREFLALQISPQPTLFLVTHDLDACLAATVNLSAARACLQFSKRDTSVSVRAQNL